MTSAAAAPSLVCEELPAVTVPFAWKTGFSFASASSEVSARGPSSLSKIVSVWTGFGRRRSGPRFPLSPARSRRRNGLRACALQRVLMAAVSEGVGIFARDAVLALDLLGGQAHVDVDLRVDDRRTRDWARACCRPSGIMLMDSRRPR